MKIKTTAVFVFETNDTWENALESIKNQIVTDMNIYYQNDDETQMTQLSLQSQEV